jgi:hypothetical protein
MKDNFCRLFAYFYLKFANALPYPFLTNDLTGFDSACDFWLFNSHMVYIIFS